MEKLAMMNRKNKFVYVCASLFFGQLLTGFGVLAAVPPSDESVQAIRDSFLQLSRPLSYNYVVDKPARDETSPLTAESHFELKSDAARLAATTNAMALIQALWPYLTDQRYDAEAYIILTAAFRPQVIGNIRFDFISAEMPGHWPLIRRQEVDVCKNSIRNALNQPDWWYPHKVLFDRDTVLAECKTNALARANYVGAMQKTLADPGIRTGNPLEANSILLILSALDAKEAAPMFVDYAFFDFKTGNDYRRSSGNTNDFSDVYLQVVPSTTVIPRLGKDFVPLVLKRLSNATQEDRSIQAGGGATPVLAILYFIQVGLSENEAQQVVEQGLKDRNLTDAQRAALTEVQTAITNKLYRPEWLRRTSIASKKTWATPK
jgi:hypothetical protein